MTHGKDFWDNEKLAKILRRGGVVVMPTDTIYGLVGRAEDKRAVERIYQIKGRPPRKPCIILAGEVSQIAKFGVILNEERKKFLRQAWAKPTSVILPCEDEAWEHLHRGTGTLAFRLPESPSLRKLLLSVGPLIAPSANPEGHPPAQDIKEAKKYFGKAVDLYIDAGPNRGLPSQVLQLHPSGAVYIIRE